MDTVADLGLPTDSIPTRDDTEWHLEVAAVFPFFEGGGTIASIGRERVATEELLQNLRRAEEVISRDTVNAVHRIRGSFPRLEFAREAAGYAHQSLDLVEKRYRAGSALVVELIDAQGNVFTAETEATIAHYAFLRDLVELQRAVSFFENRQGRAATEAWIKAMVARYPTGQWYPALGEPGPDLSANEPADPAD